MKGKRIVGRIFKPIADFPRVVGLDQITKAYQLIKDLFNGLLRKPKENHIRESYEQAIKRLNLTATDIEKRKRQLLRIAIAYFSTGAAVFLYTIYLLISGYYLAVLMSLMLTILIMTFAIREHFRYFQMKICRLNCTYNEWFKFLFKVKN